MAFQDDTTVVLAVQSDPVVLELSRRVDGALNGPERVSACIAVNRRLQEAHRTQLAKIDAALALNTTTQSAVRTKVNAAQKQRRIERLNAAPGARPKRTPGRPFFVDNKGAHPPRNPDGELRHVRFKEKMPLVYTTKKWVAADKIKLTKAPAPAPHAPKIPADPPQPSRPTVPPPYPRSAAAAATTLPGAVTAQLTTLLTRRRFAR
jgi:hypothetical protein